MRAGFDPWSGAALAILLLTPVKLICPGDPPRSVPPAPISFGQAAEAAAKLSRLRSLVVLRGGEAVLEKYLNGGGANRVDNIKSASKSVISALVGIAVDRGWIPSVDEPIATYFPALKNDPDRRKRQITVEDLLTMRSGLESTSGRNYGAWVHSRSWVRHALKQPMVAAPRARMIYSTGNSHLLSAILTRATGRSTWEILRDELAAPLGFVPARWTRDPEGIYFGGNEMALTPRQMAAFGQLYLDGGRLGGQRILSEEWVEATFVSRGRSRRSGRLYGYGWWMREIAGCRAYYAWGYGGQFIFVIPEIDVVVVTTASAVPGEGRHRHRDAIYHLVEELIVRPVAEQSRWRVRS